MRSILALGTDREWKPPIVLTEATRGEGVPELWEKIEAHRAFLEESGQLEERRRAEPRRRGVLGRVGARKARTSSTPSPTIPSCGGCSTRCRAASWIR